ncbi:alpha/beta hydrolase [Euzebya sp.]|uniref:alpha/beta hydrolase n=1 Tax=Euzebya sp. TaxID=1971409 RepID=UPI003519A798
MKNARVPVADGVVLEAKLRLPDGAHAAAPVGAALLLHPHPSFGGHMDVWLLPTIAARLAADGWASSRINFRGVEGSTGTQTGGREEHLDAEAALGHLRDAVGDVPLAVVGWSFGAMIGLRLGRAVERWVGIGTPTRPTPDVPLAGELVPDDLPPHRTAIVGEHDQFFAPDTVDVLDPHHVVIVPGADHFMFDRDVEVADHVAAALGDPAGRTP